MRLSSDQHSLLPKQLDLIFRREHVNSVSAQVRDVIWPVAVGKIDEIHNLQLSTRNGAEVSDTLKYFSERIPATFVYSGVDVDRAGLFAGTRGQQLAGRFGLIATVAFPYQAEWQGLVATLEDALRLYRHTPGTLVGLDRYLHQRTGGMIGSLSHLLRGAAIEAILAGSEQLSKQLLDGVGLDHAAERPRLRPQPHGVRRAPAASPQGAR